MLSNRGWGYNVLGDTNGGNPIFLTFGWLVRIGEKYCVPTQTGNNKHFFPLAPPLLFSQSWMRNPQKLLLPKQKNREKNPDKNEDRSWKDSFLDAFFKLFSDVFLFNFNAQNLLTFKYRNFFKCFQSKTR